MPLSGVNLNFAIVAYYQHVFRADRSVNLHVFWEYAPSQAINIVLAVAGASVYVRVTTIMPSASNCSDARCLRAQTSSAGNTRSILRRSTAEG